MQNYVKILILSSLFFSFGSILFYSNVLVSPLSCDNDEYILDIPKNSSADFVSKKLEKNTCINSTLFKLGIYMTFNQKKIKPGLYSLKGLRNLGDLIKIVTSVSHDRKQIIIFEGWNIYDIARHLHQELNINEDKFISLCFNVKYIKSLDIPYKIKSLEGFLFPDTYIFLNTYSEKDVIKILTKRFLDMYALHINPISSQSTLGTVNIITLASIIQGEAMLVDEMSTISSVYHNRLKRKMKLEADPTILYYMTESDLELFKDEPGSSQSAKVFNKYKKINSLYNTYSIYGLPIGPINNPSLSAIKAALQPQNIDKGYLYFVADGSGGHIFSKTLREHNRNIRKIKYGY